MKAFLLYPDRDFDPTQLLVRRERGARGRNPDRALDLEQALPWNEKALSQDLGLEFIFNAMAESDLFLLEAAKTALLNSSCGLDVIRYRQNILRDCLRHQAEVRQMYAIALEAIEGSRRSHWSSFGRYPSGTLYSAVEVLGTFVRHLRALRRIAEQAERFGSDGFTRLFAMLRTELADSYFDEIEIHLRRLKFSNGVLVSAQLGQGNKGIDYVLRRSREDDRHWLLHWLPRPSSGFTFHLHPRDEAGGQALSQLRNQGVNLVANAAAKSADHILSFFQMLRTELAFYIGCLNLHQQLTKLNVPLCFPASVPFGARKLDFDGLYDPALALSSGRKPVGNKVKADGKNLIIITGANTGGKSTFLRSLALAQIMMQAGMFAPADRFHAEVREGIVTHYKREEDRAMESGKLDEELSRMSAIVDRLTPRSIVFLNESFASTNEREGSEIACQVTRALLEKGIRVASVTHLYEYAHALELEGRPDAIFLRAERQPDGTRTFRLIEGGPLQTSYGEDLYDSVFGDKTAVSALSLAS